MGKFVTVQNYLQAKALLEHDYVVFIGNLFDDSPLFACYLAGSMVIFAEYVFSNAAILRNGDWAMFEKLYSVAQEFNAPMYTVFRDRS